MFFGCVFSLFSIVTLSDVSTAFKSTCKMFKWSSCDIFYLLQLISDSDLVLSDTLLDFFDSTHKNAKQLQFSLNSPNLEACI